VRWLKRTGKSFAAVEESVSSKININRKPPVLTSSG